MLAGLPRWAVRALAFGSDGGGGLAAAIRAAGNGTVIAPLGIHHSDHRLAGDASRLVIVETPSFDWFLYEDAGYRAIGEKLAARLAEVRASGIELAAEAVEVPPRATASARRSRSTLRRCRP